MSSATPLRCPGCKNDMRAEPAAGGFIEIDRCPTCGGLWLDRGELEHMVPPPPEARSDGGVGALDFQSGRGGPVIRRCPRCNGRLGALQSRVVSGLRLDHCAEHGVFLDKGELETIRDLVSSGKIPEPPAPTPESERRPIFASVGDGGTPSSRIPDLDDILFNGTVREVARFVDSILG